MGKYMVMAGLAVIGLAWAGQAEAGGVAVRVGPVAVAVGDRGGRVGHPLPVAAGRPYYAAHGVRYRDGYYYSGRHHSHWAHRTWDPVYRRYNYYDPYLRSYYYYDAVRLGYYPVVSVIVR